MKDKKEGRIKYFLPKSYYKRRIKHYVGFPIRVYAEVLKFIDLSLKQQNLEILTRVFSLGKRKTLTYKDIFLFKEIARIYNPREEIILLEGLPNFKFRIKKIIEGHKVRATSESWNLLSLLFHEKVEHVSMIIERYINKNQKKSLTKRDIPLIFNDNLPFLL